MYDELKEEDPDLCFLIILDSLSKFTPAKEFEKFRKEGAKAMDKGLARFRGLYLQTWLDHLTPIIGKRDLALVCIGQERRGQVEKPWQKEYRVKGCQGAGFDASVRMRIQFGPKVAIGSKENKKYVGQSHRVFVFKNRVGYPNDMGTFYTSNGKGALPVGFDFGREILDVGTNLGIIKKAGAWYAYEGERLGQGTDKAALMLHQHPHVMDEVREKINQRQAIERQQRRELEQQAHA
jgi:recombination protein RecA